VNPGPGPTDAWVTLAGLARDTDRIRLGTLVSPVTFRWPGQLAIEVAQVDAMSGGRVELGIGAGWNDTEHAAMGIPFPDTNARFEMLEDQLAIVTGFWRTAPGDTFDHAGRAQSVTGAPGLPKPVQHDAHSAGVPIVMGGWGAKRTPRLAARYAAEFNLPFAPPNAVAAQFAVVHAACEAAGRDPSSIVLSVATTACVGEDEAAFVRRADAIGQSPDNLRAHQLGGTVDEVLARATEFRDAGAHRLYLQVLDLHDLEHLDLLAATLGPLAE
jgi:alkanesulfonate monooxygenase SsuD/methylene tetrahydromethanopterin reductase-like flavin-dependent oxidoreductase (luciferase family)